MVQNPMLPGTHRIVVSQSGMRCVWRQTSSGAEALSTTGFSADEYFVLDAHAKAMKLLRELRISRDIHAYR